MSYLVSLYFINAGRFYNVLTGFIKKTSAAGSLVNTDSYVHKLRIILISLLPKNNKKNLLMIPNRLGLAADLQPFATSFSHPTICITLKLPLKVRS